MEIVDYLIQTVPFFMLGSTPYIYVTASMALRLIPEHLQSQPVFVCIDDTMVSKFGKKFEDVSKLFDHAAHNGSNYLFFASLF